MKLDKLIHYVTKIVMFFAIFLCFGGRADAAQVSVTVPMRMDAVLNPTTGEITIPQSEIKNNGDADILLDSVTVTGEDGVGGTWTCRAGENTVYSGNPGSTKQASEIIPGGGYARH